MASNTITSLGCWTVRQAGGERRGQALRATGDLVDDAARSLPGEHGERVGTGAAPRLSASVPNGESGRSAKQNDSLPGLPCVARSTPSGPTATDVAHDELHRPADREVGPVSLTEGVDG